MQEIKIKSTNRTLHFGLYVGGEIDEVLISQISPDVRHGGRVFDENEQGNWLQLAVQRSLEVCHRHR